jgi:hypothetical protein
MLQAWTFSSSFMVFVMRSLETSIGSLITTGLDNVEDFLRSSVPGSFWASGWIRSVSWLECHFRYCL